MVGNVAAILQGAPVTTQDLDLLVRDTPRNRQKLEALGQELGARPREISPLADGLRIDGRAGTVDILFDRISGNLSFESLRSRALHMDVAGCQAIVASLEDVIASKEAAGRPKDLAQLPILRDTLKVRGALREA
ncbi:MAG: hypothetical protein ABUS79_21915 [Pseudomonadota bacterium]